MILQIFDEAAIGLGQQKSNERSIGEHLGQSEVRFEFAGTPYAAPLMNLPSLKIGKLEVRNVPTLLWDFSGYPGIDGVVGMTFLKHFQVEIKLDEQLVILTKLHL